MGTGISIDKRVDIYMELSKPYYYVGEWIEGVVHVNCKQPTEYGAVYIRLEGHEYCHWSEGSGKHRRSYTGQKKFFENEFVLGKFDYDLQVGHYSFPFAFPTSAEFPGSYFLSQNVNIRYPVQAYLVDFKNNKKSHPYAYNVTLMEPPRTALTPTVGSKVTTPNICCCCAQGTTKLDVQFSKNIAKSGQPVSLNIHVDNKQCKKKIENVKIQVVQNTFVQSASGANRLWKAVLGESNAPMVREYSQETYNMDVRIPIVNNSTAIGTIVANYYTVETTSVVEGCYCCCGQNHPVVRSHVHVETTAPAVAVKPTIQPPPMWNPMVAPKKVFEIPVNYHYKHNPNIQAMNRSYMH